jgi:hypothetical protein
MLDDCIKSFQDKRLINEIDVRMQCVWFLRAHAMNLPQLSFGARARMHRVQRAHD